MAMLDCVSCGKRISDEAASCPDCGHVYKGLNVTMSAPLIVHLIVILGTSILVRRLLPASMDDLVRAIAAFVVAMVAAFAVDAIYGAIWPKHKKREQ